MEEHITAGKPTMIYFSSKPVAPQSIDQEQYKALQVFHFFRLKNHIFSLASFRLDIVFLITLIVLLLK